MFAKAPKQPLLNILPLYTLPYFENEYCKLQIWHFYKKIHSYHVIKQNIFLLLSSLPVRVVFLTTGKQSSNNTDCHCLLLVYFPDFSIIYAPWVLKFEYRRPYYLAAGQVYCFYASDSGYFSTTLLSQSFQTILNLSFLVVFSLADHGMLKIQWATKFFFPIDQVHKTKIQSMPHPGYSQALALQSIPSRLFLFCKRREIK